ncbi:MAG: peptidylprolyl isomerase [Acidimicrobiia bacterium]
MAPRTMLRPALLLLCVLPLCGPAAGSPQAEPVEAGAVSAADTAFNTLKDSLTRLRDLLQAKGGIAPEDHGVIRGIRDRAAGFSRRWVDDPRGVALELQLSIWLQDHDRVNELFARLAELSPDRSQVADAWLEYFRRNNIAGRVDEIYGRLLSERPGDRELAFAWASYHKGLNHYARAMEILQDEALDLATLPKAAVALSGCLFAEHRFQEAVDVLQSIPVELLKADPDLARTVGLLLPGREEYLDLWDQEQEIRYLEASAGDLPRVELLTARGRIEVELFENEAPNTVANFISLAKDGFYDGTKFHRVITNFMAQGGDPNTKPGATGVAGRGSPGYRIQDEHDREGARNHFTGSLAMAKRRPPHTAGCQFYLTHEPTPHLNGKHTVFGRVTEGLDVVRSLELDDVIEKVTVLRDRGHDYEPQTLPVVAATDLQPAQVGPSLPQPPATKPAVPQ